MENPMNVTQTSRRQFSMLAAAALVAPTNVFAAATTTVSIGQIIARANARAKPGWAQAFPAGLVVGNTDVPARGIVTTSMATVDVIRQAASMGANLIFSCEPTLFGRNDDRADPSPRGRPGPGRAISANDPVLMAKKKLIADNGIVVFRIDDGWASGDDMSRALGRKLGWNGFRTTRDQRQYEIPPTDLASVLAHIRDRLGISGGMRAVGHPEQKVRRVAVLAGLRPLSDMLAYLPAADLVLVGETRDWEGPEYSSDANAAGLKKGYAQAGRVVTEDPGMAEFAAWLQTFVREVPVKTIAAKDPYWRPVR